MNPSWRAGLTVLLGILIGGVVGTAIAALAFDATIDIGDHILSGNEGELVVLGTFTASEVGGVAGQSCGVSVSARNPESVHPDNDILVTGQTQFVATDMEPAVPITKTGTLVLADVNTVELMFGPDEIWSAGASVTVDCQGEPEETTTTTQPEVTTTTVPEVTATTLSPPPVGGVDTGGGALEHLVSEDPIVAEYQRGVSFWAIIRWVVMFGAIGAMVWFVFDVVIAVVERRK